MAIRDLYVIELAQTCNDLFDKGTLQARAEVTEERDRRVTVRGSLHDGEVTLVEAAATFRRPRSPQ